MVVQAYYVMGDADSAFRVQTCAIWNKVEEFECGTAVGRTWHCSKKGCPNCTHIRLIQFFEEKDVILEQELTAPMVLIFDAVGTLPLTEDVEEDFETINKGFSDMRTFLTRWTDQLKKVSRLARDHIYALLCRCKDNVATFGIAVLGNEEPGDLEGLAAFLSQQMGEEVEGRRCTGDRSKMIRLFPMKKKYSRYLKNTPNG